MAQARTETADERRNLTRKRTNVNVVGLLFCSFSTHYVCACNAYLYTCVCECLCVEYNKKYRDTMNHAVWPSTQYKHSQLAASKIHIYSFIYFEKISHTANASDSLEHKSRVGTDYSETDDTHTHQRHDHAFRALYVYVLAPIQRAWKLNQQQAAFVVVGMKIETSF